jgi:flagellar basal-body rod protein FlgB
MNLDAIPLFAMLKSRLTYVGERQKVLAENIANASTPGFAPHDLKPFAFQAAMAGQGGATSGAGGGSAAAGLMQTQAGHMAMTRKVGKPAGSKSQMDSEITLDGNGVVLEEQMIKMTDARMDYDAAIGFYQKSLSLLRMAAKAPGK